MESKIASLLSCSLDLCKETNWILTSYLAKHNGWMILNGKYGVIIFLQICGICT